MKLVYIVTEVHRLLDNNWYICEVFDTEEKAREFCNKNDNKDYQYTYHVRSVR